MRRSVVLLVLLAACRAGSASEPATPSTEPDPAPRADEPFADEPFVEEPFEDEPPIDVPQRVPEPEPLPLPDVELKEAYELAERAFFEGQYATAVGYFKSMYERMPHPSFLYNIAESLRHLRDCYGAVKYYRLYLDADPAAKNRDKVDAKLAELLRDCPDA